MIEKNSIIQCIFDAIDEVNQLRPAEQKLIKSPETILFNQSGDQTLDSLALVNLVVAIEQKIEERFAISIGLAYALAISERANPFATVGTLAENILPLLEGSRERESA